jgi:molybdopterin synthase catalytic subunit
MIAAISEDTLNLQDAISAVTSESAGALVTFEGVVRNHSRDLSGQVRSVEYLEYEAYRPMAKREIERVIEEVEERWNVACAVSHRVGKLLIGETAVVIAVASAHRGEAFEACRYAIDRVKETVPIWKKEGATDGFWWSENPVEKVDANCRTRNL